MFWLIAIDFSQKSLHFSLLSPTSPCELSEREVTSSSNLKVVGALDNYSLVFVIFINFFGKLKDWVGQVLFLVSCLKGQVEKYVNVEACLCYILLYISILFLVKYIVYQCFVYCWYHPYFEKYITYTWKLTYVGKHLFCRWFTSYFYYFYILTYTSIRNNFNIGWYVCPLTVTQRVFLLTFPEYLSSTPICSGVLSWSICIILCCVLSIVECTFVLSCHCIVIL
jgi:hypothetical protein